MFGNNVVGIIGGLGPETTAEFYLKLIREARKHGKTYPSIVIDSLSFPFSLEKDIIQKSKNEEKILPIILKSVKRLNKAKVDFIVIPCNTVHVFIERLRNCSSVPIVSIIDETVAYVKSRKYKKIGLLATSKTIDSKLYEKQMEENGMKVILPTRDEQNIVSKIILKILENNISKKDKRTLDSIIYRMIKRGAECIILGCTDLQLILTKEKYPIEIIDSMEVLFQSTFNILLKTNEYR